MINGIRKKKRQDKHEVDWKEMSHLPDRGTSHNFDLRRRLTVAIDHLPESLRIAFVMHCIEGHKHRELSETLGIPEGTSKARVHQARRRLVEILDRATLAPTLSCGEPNHERRE